MLTGLPSAAASVAINVNDSHHMRPCIEFPHVPDGLKRRQDRRRAPKRKPPASLPAATVLGGLRGRLLSAPAAQSVLSVRVVSVGGVRATCIRATGIGTAGVR